MRRFGAVGAVTLCLLAPAAARAAVPTIGSTAGVEAVTSHGKLVFAFTSSARGLWKRVAGRQVAVECDQVPQLAPGSPPVESTGTSIKAPKSGMKLRTGFRAGKYDICTIDISRHRTPLLIALTQRGATFVDESDFAVNLVGVVNEADSLSSGGRFPSAADVVAKSNGSVVALAAPTDSPPAGKYGVYSDGNLHIAVAALSSAGRRLFFDVSGDTVSSNVFAQISFALLAAG